MEYYPERQNKLGGNYDCIRQTSLQVAVIEGVGEFDGPPNKVLTLDLIRNRLHTTALFTSYRVKTNLQF
jgi:hypothetical protein